MHEEPASVRREEEEEEGEGERERDLHVNVLRGQCEIVQVVVSRRISICV